MTDWFTIARARNILEPERIAPVLQALEDAFAPLTADIPLETAPATVFRPSPEEEA